MDTTSYIVPGSIPWPFHKDDVSFLCPHMCCLSVFIQNVHMDTSEKYNLPVNSFYIYLFTFHFLLFYSDFIIMDLDICRNPNLFYKVSLSYTLPAIQPHPPTSPTSNPTPPHTPCQNSIIVHILWITYLNPFNYLDAFSSSLPLVYGMIKMIWSRGNKIRVNFHVIL